ncbi:MAG: PQQ-binding-like beta-propeller repeat protein [Thermoguttaceae bacterium]
MYNSALPAADRQAVGKCFTMGNITMRFTYCLTGWLLLLASVSRGQDWPEFRGPLGNGHAAAVEDAPSAGLPLRWSETQNVTWKTPIPGCGWSTPVVMGGQVWLTTATEDGHDFFAVCVDARSGRVRLDRKLFHADKPEPLGNGVNCYASPSPVVEPGRVYVSFGSYGTACLDTATRKTIWTRTDLACRHYRGPGSSPILFEDLLILTMDGVDVQYLAALDKQTGRTVWKTDRTTAWNDLDAAGKPKTEGDERKAFSTPIIIRVEGKPLLISSGSKALYGYDPRTGRERWKVYHGSHTAASRPVFAEGLVMFVTGMGRTELWAVKPDGQGDVTRSHVVWKNSGKVVFKLPSPVAVGQLVFMVNDGGVASCLEIATGREIWQERIGGHFTASPIYADGRLYFCSQEGGVTVIKPGRTCELLATNTLESGFMASPAVSGKAFFLRTRTHLYRIESHGPISK